MALLGSANNVDVRVSTTADTHGVDQTQKSIGGLGGTLDRATGLFGKMTGAVALGNIAASAFSSGMGLLTGSVGDAISRVDTLNNATRTFANMGFDGKQITSTMDAIKASILGMPTALNDAVQSVEMFAASTNDLPKSQKIFAALNDGILGFGGTAAQVQTAVIQLSQGFANGKLMAADWYSMMNAGLGPALNAIAKQMGITTSSLKDGLSSGSISVGKFQDALISLDTKGGGGLASLHKIAMDSTSGIGTGIANMKTAITRGMADILKAIGPERISGAIAAIGSGFESGLKGVAGIITAIMPTIISGATNIVGAVQVLATGDFKHGLFGLQEDSPFVVALLNAHTFLRLIFDTITGGDPTLKKGEQGFAGIAKTLSGLQFIVKTIADVWVNFFGAAIVTVMNGVKFLIPPLMELWHNISGNLIPALVRMYAVLAPVLIPALKVLGVILGATIIAAIYILIAGLNLLVGIWTTVANVISAVITGIESGWNGMVSGITAGVNAIKTAWNATGKFLGDVWKGAVDGVSGAWKAMTDWVSSAWNITINAIGAAIHQFVTHFWEDIGFAIGFIISLPIKVIAGFVYMAVMAMQVVGTWLGNMAFAIFSWAENTIKWLMGINWGAVFMGMWNAVVNAAVGMGNAIGSAAGNMWNSMVGTWNGIVNFISHINWAGIGIGAANAIGGAFVGMWDWVKNAAIGAWNFIMKINWGGILSNIGRGIANAIVDLIQGGINGALSGIPGKPKVNLPHFAHGVENFKGGYAVINDGGGGEIVNLPDGSSVIPADKSRAMLEGRGQTTVHIGQIVLGNAGAVDRFFTQLDQDTINLGKGLSPARSLG